MRKYSYKNIVEMKPGRVSLGHQHTGMAECGGLFGVHVIVVTWARGICLICMPTQSGT